MNTMKTLSTALVLCCVCQSAVADKESDAIAKVLPTIKSWSTNSTLVSAVKEQNAKNMTLDDIKAKDQVWAKAVGVDAFMKSLMENAAATELSKLEKSEPYFIELILMDKSGANVAMTNKTSDYWQGDEPKYQETYPKGPDALHKSEAEFDDSVNGYVVQISIPIVDSGSNVGALTVGVNLDEIK